MVLNFSHSDSLTKSRKMQVVEAKCRTFQVSAYCRCPTTVCLLMYRSIAAINHADHMLTRV